MLVLQRLITFTASRVKYRLTRERTVFALATLLLLIGCGPKSDRLAITGDITLDGQPLDSGSISFTSLGEKLTTSGAVIHKGAYSIPQEKGLRVGSYQVEISSPDEKGKPIFDRLSGMMLAPERIPPEYNIATNKTVEVTLEGDNKFDFNIASKPKK